MSLSGARYPGTISGGATICSYLVSWNVIVQSGNASASINFDDGGGINFPPAGISNPSVASNIFFSNEGGPVTVNIGSSSSLWDWSMTIFEDGIEIHSSSGSNDNAGDHSFTFTPQCGSVYDIQVSSIQHA